MEWEPSAEQRSYQEAFRGWLAEMAPSATLRGWLDAGDPSAFERRFAADGWAGVGLPEDLGGQGGGLTELALTAEELGRAAAPSSAWLATVLAAPALAGRPDLVTAALEGQAVALLLPADAMPSRLPPHRGGAAGAGPGRAQRSAGGSAAGGPQAGGPEVGGSAPGLTVGEDGSITGSVPLVLGGDRAARFVALAGDGERAALRLVDAGSAGVRVTPRRLLDRSRSVADVTLDRAGSEPLAGDAETVLARIRTWAGVLLAADSLGAASRMLDLAVAYSKQRHQFGVPIGSFQAVKHAAATMLVGVEAARSIVYFATATHDDPDGLTDAPPPLLVAAAAKAQVTADGAAAADSALTLHGAIGYTWEHDLQLYYKRAKLDERLYGPPAAWHDLIASALALA